MRRAHAAALLRLREYDTVYACGAVQQICAQETRHGARKIRVRGMRQAAEERALQSPFSSMCCSGARWQKEWKKWKPP